VEMEKFMVEVEDGLLEQGIPLYLRQDQEEEEEGSGASFGASSSPSSGLMSYPPLAYLLNSFLIGVNFLRECPLLSLRDKLLSLLGKVFRDLCNFLVLSSDDIKLKGKKYIIDSSNDKTNGGDKTSSQHTLYEANMDRVYASKIIDDVIPHCLDCFKMIFSSPTSTSPTTTSDFLEAALLKKSDLQFLASIKEAEQSCRKVLVNGSLVRTLEAASPPVPPVHNSLGATKNTEPSSNTTTTSTSTTTASAAVAT
jgi:hypothetical protein